MKKKENGNMPIMLIFVFFLIFLLFGIAATMMSYAQLMTHQHEIDDDLCDSVLSSMVVDLDRYNTARQRNDIQTSTSTDEIEAMQAQLSAKIDEQNQHRTNATKAKQDVTTYQKQADDLEKQAKSKDNDAFNAEQRAAGYQRSAENDKSELKWVQEYKRRLEQDRSNFIRKYGTRSSYSRDRLQQMDIEIRIVTDQERSVQEQVDRYNRQAERETQEARRDREQAKSLRQEAQEKRTLSAQASQKANAEENAAKALQPEIDHLNQQLALLNQKPTDQVAVYYQSVDHSFSLYKSCFNNAKKQNNPAFFQNFSYDTYILYEVDPAQNKITVTSFSPNGQKTVTTGQCGSVYTPDGKQVKETSAYAKVSFAVKTYFQNIPAEQKARTIYCTIDQTKYLQK